MDKYIHTFPHQLTDALRIGKKIPVFKFPHPVQNILITGMGGSSIGGVIVKEYVQQLIRVPIATNNDYNLPAYANKNTLVICSSYSGETAETLAAMQDALKKKCNIICISSGGKMLQLAAQKKLMFMKIPGGMPPRTCIGYSIVLQLFFLMKAGLLKKEFVKEVESASQTLYRMNSAIRKNAKSLAEKIHLKIPIIYSSAAMHGVGTRWKQQMNENPEVHCFANVLPEMNHNELVAYRDKNDTICVIFLRSKTDSPAIQRRFALSKKLIAPKVHGLYEITAEGETELEKIFYLVHFGDWVSYHLSVLRNVDAVEIVSLNWLKKQLAKK